MTEKVIQQGYRFVVIDEETGEILDDAQGYGYTTAQKAYKGYYYKKNRTAIEEKFKETSKTIEEWLAQNPSFAQEIDQVLFISLKDDDPSYVKNFFKEYQAPFTPKEYDKYVDYKSRKRKNKNKKRKK